MAVQPWESGAPGVLELQFSRRRFRGRALRDSTPPGPDPTLSIHLAGRRPPPPVWEQLWIRWPDFWLPSEPTQAQDVLRIAYDRSVGERVELACGGGVGRTGTGLAALAVLDGLEPDEAVAWVRRHHHPRAVELPWQRRFLRATAAGRDGSSH